MARSAEVVTGVVAEALCPLGSGSGVGDVTMAVFVMVEPSAVPAGTRASMVTMRDWPAAMVAKLQPTSVRSALTVHVASAGAVTPFGNTSSPFGRGSSSTTVVAFDGPALAMVRV